MTTEVVGDTMKVDAMLKDAQDRLQRTADKINALEADKQEAFKEALRIEGEIRLLKQLTADSGGSDGKD
jgi:hypothetical protein